MADQTEVDGMTAHERALLRLSMQREGERTRLLREAHAVERQIADITRRYQARIAEMRRQAEQLRIDGNGLHGAATSSLRSRQRANAARQRQVRYAGQRLAVPEHRAAGRSP